MAAPLRTIKRESLQTWIRIRKAHLELSNDRETALIDEKSKRLDLLSAEKEEKRALMPPAEEKEKSRNWRLRLVGAR